MTSSRERPNVAVLGLGMAGGGILRALSRSPEVRLAGAVSSRPAARERFQSEYEGRGFSTLDEVCRDPDIDAVWVATPSEYHAEHAIKLAEHGKHIVMEKPFAVTLEQCERMIEAAERNKVVLIAGGSHSLNPAYLSMREVVVSGRLGRLGAMTDWAFTEWMVRPREPHEVQSDRDGGELLNQGPHPMDALRLIGGGMVRSVRGTMLDFGLPGRECAGYFTAYLEFEDGTPATVVYDGYGYIGGWETVTWGDTPARQSGMESQYAYRRQLRDRSVDEDAVRPLSRYGNSSRGGGEGDWTPGSPGNVIVSCERGEIRQSPKGLFVYDDDGRHEEAFTVAGNVRHNEALELTRALRGERIFRDGRWGMATLEAVLAIGQSAKERKEIYLSHQVPVVDGLGPNV